MARTYPYTVSIAFNYGQDEASRQVKSGHNTESGARRAAARLQRSVSDGWAVQVDGPDGVIDWRS